MRETRIMMGMPITVEITGLDVPAAEAIHDVFAYFTQIDEKFSTYKKTSEITAVNEGRLKENGWSPEMKEIFALSAETKRATDGYFDIVNREGKIDPSGIVKGWAIQNAAKLLDAKGIKDFFIDAGGDIQTRGKNSAGLPWSIGIRDPFDATQQKVVKILYAKENRGVATSGTYVRGNHIYDPYDKSKIESDIVSLTVIGPDIYEADRFATAAFAMGKKGIGFIEGLKGFEGYMIDSRGVAVMTSGFEKYTK
jgi:thiamine biosynthesis lipoprotein